MAIINGDATAGSVWVDDGGDDVQDPSGLGTAALLGAFDATASWGDDVIPAVTETSQEDAQDIAASSVGDDRYGEESAWYDPNLAVAQGAAYFDGAFGDDVIANVAEESQEDAQDIAASSVGDDRYGEESAWYDPSLAGPYDGDAFGDDVTFLAPDNDEQTEASAEASVGIENPDDLPDQWYGADGAGNYASDLGDDFVPAFSALDQDQDTDAIEGAELALGLLGPDDLPDLWSGGESQGQGFEASELGDGPLWAVPNDQSPDIDAVAIASDAAALGLDEPDVFPDDAYDLADGPFQMLVLDPAGDEAIGISNEVVLGLLGPDDLPEWYGNSGSTLDASDLGDDVIPALAAQIASADEQPGISGEMSFGLEEPDVFPDGAGLGLTSALDGFDLGDDFIFARPNLDQEADEQIAVEAEQALGMVEPDVFPDAGNLFGPLEGGDFGDDIITPQGATDDGTSLVSVTADGDPWLDADDVTGDQIFWAVDDDREDALPIQFISDDTDLNDLDLSDSLSYAWGPIARDANTLEYPDQVSIRITVTPQTISGLLRSLEQADRVAFRAIDVALFHSTEQPDAVVLTITVRSNLGSLRLTDIITSPNDKLRKPDKATTQ